MVSNRSRLYTIIIILTSLTSIALHAFPVQGLPNYGPGVKPGDEVTYGKFSFTSNLPYPIFPANVTDLKVHVNTVNPQTKDVNASLIYNFKNGTQQTQQLFGNTVTGVGNLFPYLVAGNLTTGNLLFNSPNQYYPQYIFNETVQRQYAGMVRTVNLFNLTISQPANFVRITFYWDAQTGMLLEASEHSIYGGPSFQSFSIYFEATSTNIWSTSTSPDFTFDAASITTDILHAGETANFQFALASISSFSGKINITAAPTIPTNQLSTTVNPSTVTLTSTITNAKASLQVSTSKTTPVGLYIINVNGTSGSKTDHDFLLVAVAPPDFTISADPASLTLSEGTVMNSTLTVTGRGGFNGTIAFQVQPSYGGTQVNVQLIKPFVTVNATTPTATTILTIDATFSLPGATTLYLTANSGNIYRSLSLLVNVTGPDFRIASNPASLTLRQDQSAETTVQVTSILSFKGFVDLTASSYGVTAALSATALDLTPGGNANSTLTVTAPFGVSPGQYGVNILGQDTRGLIRSIYIPVTVTGPDFTIAIDRSSTSLRAGQSANFTLTLSTVDRFNGTITLSTTAYGSLVTTINPTILTLDTAHATETAKVMVTVPPGASPSNFSQVSIEATNGIIQHYTFINVNIVGPDFIITPNPDLLTLKPGESGTSTLTLSSIENFTGTISLFASTSGPISATVNPVSVTLAAGGSVTANLTITVPSTAVPGYDSVNVQATSGSVFRTVYVTVFVVGPDFTINGFPASLTLQQGQTSKTSVSIQSLENFTGTIKLTSFAFYPLLLTPNSTTVSLGKGSTATIQFQFSAPLNATPGFYNAQIQATSGGLSHTAYFSVHIIGPTFSIFPSPQSLTIKQGGSTTSTVFLNSIDGFAGNVSLTTTNYGLIVTPSTTLISVAAGQSANITLNVQVPTSTSIGSYYISINAHSGNIQQYSAIFVQVTGPDFNLLAFPSQQTIEAGKSTTATLQLTSLEGLAANITLTENSYGANATNGSVFVKLNPARVTLSSGGTASAILNITTTRAAAGTSLQIFITATGPGQTHYASVFIAIIGPSFGLSATPSFLTITNGGSTTTNISVTSIDNFSGQVNLTAATQFGLTATLSSQNITLAAGGTSTDILTVSTVSGTTSGFYSVQVTGTSGNQTRSLYVTVQVVAPNFIVQATPSDLTIRAGRSQQSSIQLISLNGYHGNVTLRALFASENSTASPIRVTITPSTVHLATGGSVSALANITTTISAAGSYFISIQATDGNRTNYTSIFVTVIGPTFFLSASPQFLTVPQGGTATTTITTSSIDNFTGIVHLSVNSPFGFTAALSPENVTLTAGGLSNSTLAFTVHSPSAGFYTLTVTGTAANLTRTFYVSVHVTTVGTFTIMASPSFLQIPSGGTAQATLTAHGMGGFTGSLSLFASSMPIGPTATMSPTSIILNSTMTVVNATVTISLPANATSTLYTIVLGATGNGMLQTTTILVQVQPPDFTIVAQPTNVTIRPPNSQTVKLTITGTGGYNHTLHFFGLGSLQGFGITYSFSPANVTITPTNRVANVTATITVPRDVEPGVWEVDLWAYYNITGEPGVFSGHFARISLTILPTPEFQILTLPYYAYLYQGTATTVSATLQSLNGFSGNVAITAGSSPAGIAATPSSFVTNLSSNATDKFNITFAAGLNTPPGVYIAWVNATSQGISRWDGVLVIVKARPDFTMSAYPGSLIVQAGGKESSTITLTSLNFFNATTTLSATGSPPGVSASISPSSLFLLAGQVSANLTISASSSAKPGTYTVYITGNSTWATHTINVTVTIIRPLSFSVSETEWTHRLSLSKTSIQTFTATIKNTGSNPAYIQLLAAGNSTSSSLFFNRETFVATINPGQALSFTITQQFSSNSIGQKYTFTLQLFYGTMIDGYGNILNPNAITEAQGTFSVAK